MTHVGLVHGAAGAAVVEERSAVEGSPVVVDRLCHVGRDDVRVKEWVARTAGAMVEGGRNDPVGRDPAPLRARAHRLRLDELDGLVDGLSMRLTDRGPCLVVAERPQDAHALGWPEHQVVAGPRLGLAVVGSEAVDFVLGDDPGEVRMAIRAFGLRADQVGVRQRRHFRTGSLLGCSVLHRLRAHGQKLPHASLGEAELARHLERVEKAPALAPRRRSAGGRRLGRPSPVRLSGTRP